MNLPYLGRRSSAAELRTGLPAQRSLLKRTAGALCILGLALNGLISQASAQTENDYFDQSAKQRVFAQTSSEDRPYVVDLRSRIILPRKDTEIPYVGGRAAVYIQFEKTLNAKERGRLKRLGVRFDRALGKYTYLARIKDSAEDSLKAMPLLRGIEPVVYADRMNARMYRGSTWPGVVAADGTWSVHVWFHEDVSLAHALHTLDRLEVKAPVRDRMLFNHKLLVKASWERLFDLAQEPTVRMIEEIPPSARDFNASSAALSNVDDVQGPPFNLNGDGVLVGQWESGNADVNHVDLLDPVSNAQRITVVDAGAGETGHGTHVAGTMMSTGVNDPMGNSMGMAPSIDGLFSWSFGGDTATEQANGVDNQGINLANHSWGSNVGWDCTPCVDSGNPMSLFGQYDATAMDWDAMVRAKDLPVMKSSGNDGFECNPVDNTDCDGVQSPVDNLWYANIGTQGNAKNIVTVGATDDAGLHGTFSSAGPSDDNRIKPDVVANGVQLRSTCSTAAGDAAAWCNRGGTSMAAPTTSGVVALLIERIRDQLGYTPGACTVKALLVNTAQDMGRTGPDFLHGHGLVDALEAMDRIDSGAVRILSDSVDDGQEDEFLMAVPGSLTELRATLVWLDPEAASGANPTLINDLDLELVGPDGTSINFPYSGPTANFTDLATRSGPNTVDNVENSVVDTPDQGFWTVRVKGTSVPDGPQNYCVVVSQSLALGSEPDISVNASLDFDEICDGEIQDEIVSIFNTGFATLQVHEVSVTAGMADFTVLTPPSQPFLVLPGSHVDVTVRFSPSTTGMRAGTLEIRTNDPDEGTIQIPMTGDGGAPAALGVFPSGNVALNVDFGNVMGGQPSNVDVYVVNNGTCDLNVTSLAVVGTAVGTILPASHFEGLVLPIVIFPGETLTLPLQWTPAVGVFDPLTGSLLVNTNDTANPQVEFPFEGRSEPPILTTTGSTDFGTLCAGGVSEIVFNICNTGFNNLDVTSVDLVEVMALTMTGPPAPGPATALAFMGDDMGIMGTAGGPMPGTERGAVGPFSLVNSPFPAEVSKDFCLPLTIRMEATQPGVFEANLEITTNDPNVPGGVLVVPILGSVGTGDLMVNLEATGQFENVLIGENKTLTLQVVNEGVCNLNFTVMPDVSDPEIAIAGQGPDLNWILAPGEHINFPFTYTPVDFDPDTASWLIVSDDPINGIVLINLRGLSPAPDIRTTGSTDFGVVCPGDLAEKVIEICNVGFNNLDVTSVEFDPPCDDFELINNPFPAEVSKDFCMPLTIRYTPTGVGMHSCNLRILSDDPDEPEVNLTVTGETPPSLISVPDDIEFPATVVQKVDVTCKSPSPFQIENVGVCPLEIVDVVLSDTTNYEFVNLPLLPVTLLPGESLADGTLMIVFKPEVVQHQIPAQIDITYVSNDPTLGDTAVEQVLLCGEGAKTGARILAVDQNGDPKPLIHKLQLWKLLEGGGAVLIEQANNLPPQVVPDNPPCTGFTFHHEWGGETNPTVVLEPCDYRAEVVIGFQVVNVFFTIEDECDFIPDLVAVFFPQQ